MKRNKIALVGSGNIGGTLAHMLALQQLGNIALIDVAEGVPQGKALDLSQAMAIEGIDIQITGGNDYSLLEDSDVVIVTAGIARKPGMNRGDLLAINASVIRIVASNIKKYCPKAFVIVVTNPLDVMVGIMQSKSALPHSHVVGMAGILDSGRYSHFLAEELGLSVADIQTFVLGGHGDGMVPLPRYTTVAGIPFSDLIAHGAISEETVTKIIERTRNGGGEIVNLLKTGSAFYAPAAAATAMTKSYLLDQRRILPCAAWLSGEYGIHDLYVGVPVIIGANGVEKIIELDLSDKEKEEFTRSVDSVRSLMAELEQLATS